MCLTKAFKLFSASSHGPISVMLIDVVDQFGDLQDVRLIRVSTELDLGKEHAVTLKIYCYGQRKAVYFWMVLKN